MAAPRPPRFSPGLSQSDLAADYKKIGDRKPFTKNDLSKAYQPYDLKISPARSRGSDATLYKEATRAVLARRKKLKDEEEAAAVAQKAAEQRAAAQAAAAAASYASYSSYAPAAYSPAAYSPPAKPATTLQKFVPAAPATTTRRTPTGYQYKPR